MRRLYTFWFPVALLAAPVPATLEREWTRMAPQAGGIVGVAALHLETGRRISLRGGERFPMASTYKVPIAVQLLGRVERGEISLDQMVPLAARDVHPGSGTLTDLFNKPGLALSVRNDASPERAQAARVRVDRDIELPAGVLRVAPLEETVTGRIVVPEARFGDQTARGITFEIRKGRLTRVSARENQAAVQVAPHFREFALGFNPKLTGLAYFGYGAGTVRLSFGDNEELRGAVRGGAVRWFFFPPTVEVDGQPLVR